MRAAKTRSVVLVISNIAWDFVWQRHQSVSSQLARDREVIFCEVLGIRRLSWRDFGRVFGRLRTLTKTYHSPTGPLPAGLRIVRPFLLPATNAIFHAINAWLLRSWLRKQSLWANSVDLIWNYSASRSALWLIDHIPHRQLVYDCTDDWLAVKGVPACLKADEAALLTKADFTLVPSRALLERKKTYARRIERMPHGAMAERFFLPRKSTALDGALTLLYYGHLHRQHLDFAAIETLASSRPKWTVILVGPVKTSHSFPSNVRIVGQQPHEALREFIRDADVLILPYALNRYTEAVLPAKIYECLATGRPVVAAPLPELLTDFVEFLSFASEPGEWANAVEKALQDDSPERASARVAIAKANSWDERFAQIQQLLKFGDLLR